jgi:hypothetical protein
MKSTPGTRDGQTDVPFCCASGSGSGLRVQPGDLRVGYARRFRVLNMSEFHPIPVLVLCGPHAGRYGHIIATPPSKRRGYDVQLDDFEVITCEVGDVRRLI